MDRPAPNRVLIAAPGIAPAVKVITRVDADAWCKCYPIHGSLVLELSVTY
jgi:hypothetical protein